MLRCIFMKRLKSLLTTLLAIYTMANAQVALKTNVPLDVLRLPNAAIEVGMSRKFTADITGYYNPWEYSEMKQHKVMMLQPELRYWLCDIFNGHFFGFHLMSGVYNTMGIEPPIFPLWDDMKDYRYKGWFAGGGISYGYSWILDRHWNIEATIGFGYNYVDYQKYECINCGSKVDEGDTHYIGHTKAAVNLIDVF